MGILDIFTKKPEKNKYEIYHDSISEVLKILERKKNLTLIVEKGGSIIDTEFDKNLVEKSTLLEVLKNGTIAFLGNDLIKSTWALYEDEEIKRDQLIHVWNYLVNEQKKLRKLF